MLTMLFAIESNIGQKIAQKHVTCPITLKRIVILGKNGQAEAFLPNSTNIMKRIGQTSDFLTDFAQFLNPTAGGRNILLA